MMFEHSNGIRAGANRSAPASRSAAHVPVSPESSRALTTAEASHTRRAVTADRHLLPQELPRCRYAPRLRSHAPAPEPVPHRQSACRQHRSIVHADTPATTFPRVPPVPPARRGHRRVCLGQSQPPCSHTSSNAAEMQTALPLQEWAYAALSGPADMHRALGFSAKPKIRSVTMVVMTETTPEQPSETT